MYINGVTDRLGLVRENKLLVVVIPREDVALVFRVVYRKVFKLEYPMLPLKKGMTLAMYGGGTVTVPEDGIFPPMSFTDRCVYFPMPNAYDPTDMFYVPKDWKDTIFHVYHHVKPGWIRIEVEIPPDTIQISYQRDKISGGVSTNFGFARGTIEVIHLPDVKVGYKFGNDTSAAVLTSDFMIIGEYHVELVLEPEVVFDAIVGKIPAYVYTLPVYRTTDYVMSKIEETYGFRGFPIYPSYKREEAIKTYEEIVKQVKK